MTESGSSPNGAGLYWFRISGPVERTVCLEAYEDRDLQDWKAHVAEKRGWDDLPVSPVDKLNATIKNDPAIWRLSVLH